MEHYFRFQKNECLGKRERMQYKDNGVELCIVGTFIERQMDRLTDDQFKVCLIV